MKQNQMDKLDNIIKKVLQEGDTYEKMAAKGKKAGNLKQGTVRKRLGIPKDEKIPLSKINKEISRLKKMDKDKDKKGVQLGDKNQKYYKALQLSKTLKTTTNVNEEFKKGDKVTYLGNPGKITFVGKDVMGDIYYSVAYDRGTGRTKVSNLYNKGGEIKAVKEDINEDKYFSLEKGDKLKVPHPIYKNLTLTITNPKGSGYEYYSKHDEGGIEKGWAEAGYFSSAIEKGDAELIKAVKEDINDPVLVKTRAAQMKRDAMDKKDQENKSKRISAEKAIDLRYELSILNKEREDILMRIEDLGFETEQTAEPEGGKKADDVGKRMEIALKDLRDIDNKIIDIKDDLGVFDMNEIVNEEDRATRVDKMLSGKYKDEDYKDSKRYADVRADLEDEIGEEIETSLTSNEISDELVGKEYASPAFESLYQSLKEKLNQRLGK